MAWGEIWKQRELLAFLTWRDIQVRYKQTVLGVVWALLKPTVMMIIFTIVFGGLAALPVGGVPKPVFYFTGLLPWMLFAGGITAVALSVVGSERLVTKVYFPRLIVPWSAIGAPLVDFAMAIVVLVGLLCYYDISPALSWLAAPLAIAVLTLGALGIGTLLAALTVAYRDFRIVTPFLVQAWMFATPAIYLETAPAVPTASAQAPAVAASLTPLELNPAQGAVRFFRASCLGQPLPWKPLALSAGLFASCFVMGCAYFRIVEDTFADVI